MAIILLTADLIIAFPGKGQGNAETKLNLTLKNTTLKNIFRAIESKTELVIMYELTDKAVNEKVDIDVKNMSVAEILDTLLKNTSLKWQIRDNIIRIDKASGSTTTPAGHSSTPPVSPSLAIPPVTGIIRDSEGKPLEGISIIIKGTTIGTITDADGRFSIEAQPGATLVISSVEFETQQYKVGVNQKLFVIKLNRKIAALNEVVVNKGYYTTTQRFNTGSVVRVDGKDIRNQPVMNPLIALQGRVPGLIITQTTGYAASPVKVELRGRSDLNSSFTSDPLYIIDGVPLTVLNPNASSANYQLGSAGFNQGASNTGGLSPLFSLDPKNIESIEVLKDADATAIYGSRGAKGVILITTKKGKQGPPQLNLSINQGISKVTRYWNMLNTPQYLQARREAFINSGLTPTVANAPDILLWDTARYTNWQKEAFGGTGKVTSVNASLSGGNAQTTFLLSGNYSRTTDITAKTGSTQFMGISSAFDYHNTENAFTVKLSSNYSFSTVNVVLYPSDAITLPPDAPPVFDKSGNLNWAEWNQGMDPYFPLISFPFGTLKQTNPQKTNFLNANLMLSYKLFKGLSVSASLGYNNAHNASSLFMPIASQNPLQSPIGQAFFSTSDNSGWIAEPQLNYSVFIGKGKLDVLAGATMQSTLTQVKMQIGSGYTNDNLLGTITAAPYIFGSDANTNYKYAGIFARAGYIFSEKYIINLCARRDGSSRFGPGRQFGNFGSVGIAWIVSEENWLKRILPAAIPFLKFRASYGTTGSDGVGDYQYISQWSSATPSSLMLPSYGNISPLMSIHAVNPLFQWQVNKKFEGALELGLLKGSRINIQVAYYRDRTGNQLVPYPTPLITGFPFVTANSPVLLQNSGLEGFIVAKLIQTKNFNWNINFNIGINRNKLVSFPDLENSPYATSYRVGKPTNIQFAYHYMGVDPVSGKYAFQDYNHDGVISMDASVPPGTADDDRGSIINFAPKYAGGFGTQLGYKNVSAVLFFSFKKQIGINAFASTPVYGGTKNIPAEVLNDHWQKPGDQTLYGRFSARSESADYNFAFSDGIYTDASYLRLSNLVISYSLPEALIKKMRIKGCNLSLQAQNVFVITRYKGVDPETQNFGSIPPAKVFTGNISFNF